MKRAIIRHPNPKVGLVSVAVTEEHENGMITGTFAAYQKITGTPMTPEDIKAYERGRA